MVCLASSSQSSMFSSVLIMWCSSLTNCALGSITLLAIHHPEPLHCWRVAGLVGANYRTQKIPGNVFLNIIKHRFPLGCAAFVFTLMERNCIDHAPFCFEELRDRVVI